MITAAHRTSKKAQEILATGNGEVLTFPATMKSQALTDTASISGPAYFVGMVVVSGTESAQMTASSEGSTIFAFKVAGAGNVDGLLMPFPVYCPNGITCTKAYGNNATFIVYYIEG